MRCELPFGLRQLEGVQSPKPRPTHNTFAIDGDRPDGKGRKRGGNHRDLLCPIMAASAEHAHTVTHTRQQMNLKPSCLIS